ncbi:hypothetical protein ILUMI_06620 [Ignelater luminosus]|uniref:Uncharacterized protein n=1 Tax=Ignelater luminosus TaxID=2038154 RepID=A0A8K0D8W1_IGNLU|nr:hypothetical protein ILUMI_06620 [Ignelater luminosus]
MWFVVLVSTTILVWCIRFISKSVNYWKEKDVAYIAPWPFSEKSVRDVFKKQGFFDWAIKTYNTYPDKRYVNICYFKHTILIKISTPSLSKFLNTTRYMGVYAFQQPILVIRDPDLIKNIMVKWFDVFSNHRAFGAKNSDPFWNKNLFAMKSNYKAVQF